jgi:hypothetical protein
MDHPESIPVDTHVWQIALRDYGFSKKGKTLNSKLYLEVGDHFRTLFGDYSGWAHSVSVEFVYKWILMLMNDVGFIYGRSKFIPGRKANR